jgi:hypothetical protein
MFQAVGGFMYTSSCNSVFPCGITQAQLALNDLDGALWSLTNASQLEPNDGKQMVDHLLI